MREGAGGMEREGIHPENGEKVAFCAGEFAPLSLSTARFNEASFIKAR